MIAVERTREDLCEEIGSLRASVYKLEGLLSKETEDLNTALRRAQRAETLLDRLADTLIEK